MTNDDLLYEHPFKSICEAWVRRIAQARKAKSAFQNVADQCHEFFAGATGFMWKDKFMDRYMGGRIAPRFKLTVAKGFELVAVIGPTLYWKYPNRVVRSWRPIEFDETALGDPEDPEVQEMFAEIMREQQIRNHRTEQRNRVMQAYLNYSQREQPGGGLARHSETAITEALVKGRGCLWVQPYEFPGSHRTLTQCVYDTVDNLYIDPDAEDPGLQDATWIARRHCEPYWKVEERFELPSGSLKDKAHLESSESQAANNTPEDVFYRKSGETSDRVVWFEIFSKGGVGTRMRGISPELRKGVDEVIGDYAYICIANGVEYPLNAPSSVVRNASTRDVSRMFRWPVPYWADGRWPVALLDFYRKPRSPWPLAPMAAGLGELMFLNVMMSLLCNRVYSSSRDIIAYLKSAASNVEAKLKSGEYQVFMELNDAGPNRKLTDIIQFLQQPPVNFDLFRVMDMVSEQFDKRTGLTELLYGLNPGGKVSRTATDAAAKQEMVSVRPEYMANKVEEWQSEVAQLEKFCAGLRVSGEDIRELITPLGVHIWKTEIEEQDPEALFREMKATVEAGSVRKPNKAKDFHNLEHLSGFLLPEFSKHADVTGDTGPINEFFDSLGEAMDQDTAGWEMGPRQQQPSEEEMQLQQQMQEMEMQKGQLEVQGKTLDVHIKEIEFATKAVEADQQQVGVQEELAKRGLEFEFNTMEKVLDLEHKQLEHEQDMLHTEERHELDLDKKEEEADLKIDVQRELANIKLGASR